MIAAGGGEEGKQVGEGTTNVLIHFAAEENPSLNYILTARKKLSDLERVTSLKVYNWFANRRKEIKRRANIEAAILESHGIDVQSPGGHSNSDDVDGNDYSEQDTWQVRNGEEEGRCSEGGREAEKDDNTSHSDHQDPISLAVEMAAVNHTILALARQGANEIKTEALDDD
ncbi:homeobox-containing protein 1-like [Antrostomus carolinensis]|uniref:homeobox-containing protein 1-like n=1 Tax=Antrostomus carolinensis TaxID=279965 RepID=UPI0005286DBC|nr:homeobox-containing protein 1-like [Antrostomus carolinensis]